MSVRRVATWTIGTMLTAVFFAAGCAQTDGGRTAMAPAPGSALALSGAQEVPPVNTQASGTSTITVVGDKTVVGRVETSNLNATAAHIHQGPSGQNGPVVITLVKAGDNAWAVPSNTVLTSAQYDAYRRGELYVNVHSAANPNGEIRGQLKP
jgi:CHRD domain